MQEQLPLLRSDDRPWKLDEHTCEIGRRGIEAARAILRQGAPTDRALGDFRRRRPVIRNRSDDRAA